MIHRTIKFNRALYREIRRARNKTLKRTIAFNARLMQAFREAL